MTHNAHDNDDINAQTHKHKHTPKKTHKNTTQVLKRAVFTSDVLNNTIVDYNSLLVTFRGTPCEGNTYEETLDKVRHTHTHVQAHTHTHVHTH